MSRSEQRGIALRFCLATIAWVACLFGWFCVLSYDVADPPGTSVWPPNSPTANLCGPVGAWLAHHAFYYLGAGNYALLAVLTGAAVGWSYGVRFHDAWLRFAGALLIIIVVSTSGAMFVPVSDGYPMTGPGGVLGAATSQFLLQSLQTTGTLILLACAFVVGLLLAADELVIRTARGLRWAGQRSAPAIVRGGTAVASAGAAVASGVAGRLAAAGAEWSNGPSDSDPVAETQVAAEKPARPRGSRRKDPPYVDDFANTPEIDENELAEEAAAADESPAAPDGAAASETDGPDADAAPAPDADEDALWELDPGPSGPPRGPKPGNGAILGELSGGVKRPLLPAAALPAPPNDNYELPEISLLEEPTPVDTHAIELRCREKALILEQTLNEFKLEVRVVAIETGPVITVFELKLAAGIKVSQIASLTNDMARALKAPAVRVVAPLPGKNTIGIEVPNVDKEKVRLRDIIDPREQRYGGCGIPLFLGKDASGQPLITDLCKMPHLLIAGTTGSGKSVCVSSVVMSILLSRTPQEVNLILVDPKVVELAMFKDIPHLMCPIVTETSKAEAILDWAATKMDERYALLAEAGVKDIRSYNNLGEKGLRERFEPSDEEEFAGIPKHLPYIVIIIDELADLMMTSAKEVEFYLCRLAQKSRAVGIHLIVSTQRPQANVVTGLVKANLPCRIAFRVSSRLDSRIVLDQNGGEVLMGQGDMLFLPPGSSKLVRAQGTFISDDELRRTVRHCKEQQPQNFHAELTRMPSAGAEGTAERDELFDAAVDIIIESGRGSVSLLQRRLTIGYSRASRLIDQMYAAGIVGEYKGSQAREVIMSRDEWGAVRNQRDAEEADEGQ